jgi:hypothetical protein
MRLFQFHVPATAEALKVEFQYAPVLEPEPEVCARELARTKAEYLAGLEARHDECVRRFMTGLDERFRKLTVANEIHVTLHGPDGRFVGRTGVVRNDDPPPWHVAPGASSPGFHAARPAAGEWTAIVEPNMISSPRVVVQLSIRSESAADAAQAVRQAEAGRRIYRPPQSLKRPRMDGVLLGEMHAHTVHSDGRFTLAQLAERARTLDLDFVCLTDHNTDTAHPEVRSASSPPFLIPGQEVTTPVGHFCVYGNEGLVGWQDHDANPRLDEALVAARQAGTLVSLAHPYAIGTPVCMGCPFAGTIPYDRFDLLEVWSGAWSRRFPEPLKTLALWDRLLDQGLDVIGIAGRDWHGPDQEDRTELRFPVTAVLASRPAPEAILEAVRRGRAYMTSGFQARLRARSGPCVAGLGESLPWVPDRAASLAVRVEPDRPAAAVARLVKDGRLLQELPLPAGEPAEFEAAVPGPGRYRLEVWSRDSELLLLTNHIRLVQGSG